MFTSTITADNIGLLLVQCVTTTAVETEQEWTGEVTSKGKGKGKRVFV